MPLDAWLLFLPAAFLMAVAPGPSNVLVASHSVRFGLGPALIAVAGRIVTFAGMILITALGLGAVLAASELAFAVIKWAGVAYLAWLGFQTWRAKPMAGPAPVVTAMGLRAMMRREAMVAIGNPKAILIFTAAFPQFIDPARDYGAQMWAIGVTFLVLEWVAAFLYGSAAAWVRRAAPSLKAAVIANRVTGAAFGLGAVGLAFARRD